MPRTNLRNEFTPERRDTDYFTFPAAWASALVNGDYSGLESGDTAEAQRCRDVVVELAQDGWHIVDVKRDKEGNGNDGRFTWDYQIYDPGSRYSGGSVINYVVMRIDRADIIKRALRRYLLRKCGLAA